MAGRPPRDGKRSVRGTARPGLEQAPTAANAGSPKTAPPPRYAGAMTSKKDDDADLFRTAIGPVRKLRDTTPPPSAPKPRPRARMAERDEAAARDRSATRSIPTLLEAGDVLSYRRDALPPRSLQRLRRGEIAVQDELDLHGADAREAETLVRAFITHAREHGLGCVRIIHGKGLHGNVSLHEPRRPDTEKPGGSPAAPPRRRPWLPLRAARAGRHRNSACLAGAASADGRGR